MNNHIAQINIAPDGIRGRGPLGLEGGAESAPSVFNSILSATIGLMTMIAFIWFVFLLLGGAYGIMTAGGDKASLENARKRITMGVIGVVVIIAAIFIISLLGELIGIPDILNPGAFIENLGQ